MIDDKMTEEQKEEKRLQELYQYQILDTQEEKDFDDIVKLASQICGTPIALISLIDERRQWFKARKGVEIQETPRNIAFCTHAIKYENGMVINDASKDDRFSSIPFVMNAPNFKFYAGVPLKSGLGYNIGTL